MSIPRDITGCDRCENAERTMRLSALNIALHLPDITSADKLIRAACEIEEYITQERNDLPYARSSLHRPRSVPVPAWKQKGGAP